MGLFYNPQAAPMVSSRTATDDHTGGIKRLNNVLLGAVASLALAGTATATGQAAPLRGSAPVIPSVTLKVVLGSTVSASGTFKLQIGAGPASHGVCSFGLKRYTQSHGWQSLGSHHGTAVTESIPGPFSFTEFEMIPYACGGAAGAAAYSNEFYPTIQSSSSFSPVSGTWGEATSKHDHLNEVFYTSGSGAAAQITDGCSYSDGVEIGTGPQGGIGTVYVNGVKTGPSMNFYSKTVSGGKVRFTFSTPGETCNTIQFVATGQGKGGGYDMYLNALVEAGDAT
jgi:hypothetical protein